MTILLIGATGATGHLLARQLLDRGHTVRAVVRSPEKLRKFLQDYDRLEIIQAPILDLSDEELARHVRDCEAVASCLGHNLTWKGLFGHPRRLVTETTRRLCAAIKAGEPDHPVRYVLMNTVGNRNRDLHEPVSLPQRAVIALLRLLLPPHVDNEEAADYLRTEIGQNDPVVEWTAVRPDSLTDEAEVTEYEVYPSPTRSAIFNPGKTSRINVAHFMAELITDEALWGEWKGRMPVLYNVESG